MQILFLSSNRHKAEEIIGMSKAFGIDLKWSRYEKLEIQSGDTSEVARTSAALAYAALRKPLIVEDSGLFIDALKGFPGPYASFVYHTIGLEGILALLDGKRDRGAHFKTSIGYADGSSTRIFEGIVHGSISDRVHRGRAFGYDPIFVPSGSKKTFSEMGVLEKNKISHRMRAFEQLAEYLIKNNAKEKVIK
ncbi:MAG: XTP/dITP diphosphatase [Candidatus Micrarchaeales archaeon]|jgi:non-canonical purine NTP pyrophosphatase, rdgB/HAM1 family|uniref:Non-canonical purine NTP pyrophosphatase, rdgB/HAM1 family n=1 Tax=Candidatus Micrarchaeum acidiphilum ARMAN-2 TaxID=425595 RepID=C7DG58_MICA2|nr:MAG: non-canonical purine NTP pyrophosphatase, rdgB/HAM1 family [Candidatus Micrarchaeum acidiphilum ARMAN-2]MCW6161582.1 XTP/dITP diphosphatase [Candidatus Micrarchaeales archaeon]